MKKREGLRKQDTSPGWGEYEDHARITNIMKDGQEARKSNKNRLTNPFLENGNMPRDPEKRRFCEKWFWGFDNPDGEIE